MFFGIGFSTIIKQYRYKKLQKYATTVEQFVDKYLAPKFCLLKNVAINGKVYPGVIVATDGKDFADVLELIGTERESLTNKNMLQNTMTEELYLQMMESLKMAASETGIVYCAALPGILDKIGIQDFKQYAPTISQFCEKYLTDSFEYKDKIKINGKIHSGVLVDKNKVIDFDSVKEEISFEDALFEPYKDIEGIRFGVINVCTTKTGFINQEYVDKKVLKNYELDGSQSTIFEPQNVQFEPANTILRTVKYVYLVAYFVKGTVLNNKTGEEHPALDYSQPISIIKSFPRKNYVHIKIEDNRVLAEHLGFEENDLTPVLSEKKNNQIDYDILREIYLTKDYYAFLSSDAFKTLSFCELPRDIMIASLNSAARLMGINEDVEINGFQQELICNGTSQEFIKKWKSKSGFDQNILAECGKSSIFSYNFPTHNGYIIDNLNKIGYSNARNDNYPGLTKRFGLCHNKLLPYLFFLRAIVQESRSAVERCISEYIQLVKTIQQMDTYYLIADNYKLYLIKDFLMAINQYVYPLKELPKLLKTSIASVFVDVGEIETYLVIVNLCDPESEAVDRKLITLYYHFDECTEQQIKELLDENVSIQLLQKIVSLIWERYSGAEVLPEKMIQVLSWICLYDTSTSVDEIIRYHLLNKQFHKKQKTVQLVNSFEKTCLMAEENVAMHVMASYIRYIVCEGSSADKYVEACSEIKSQWQDYATRLVRALTIRYGEINSNNENDYLKLIRAFRLDIPNQIRLQNLFSSWYLKKFRENELHIEELEDTLDWLFSNRAYKAYCDLSIEYKNDIDYSEKLIRQYVTSLIELQQFGAAIDYLQQNTEIDIFLKNELMIRVLAENYRNNGLSLESSTVYNADFTMDDAVKLLLSNYKPNQYHLITCLISLYCEKKDYIRAAYLYTIFQSKAENGFTRLFSQIRSKLKSFVPKLKNHYGVIEFSFTALLPEDLIDFLQWTQLILVPNLKGYDATHTFAFFYDRLINSPMDENNWIALNSHLAKRMDINAWQIVVCNAVLEQVFGREDVINTSKVIRVFLNSAQIEKLPYNLLPYICTYIIKYNDSILCEDLVHVLSDNERCYKLFSENLWVNTYDEVIEQFKVFCLRQFSESGKEVFYKLMTLLGETHDVKELAVLTQTSGDKSYLYRSICNAYATSNNTTDIIELLNNTVWNNLTSQDLAMLSLLRLLYSEEEVLLNDRLFENEAVIYRFKSDCAKILSVYPDKTELFEFDKNCTNEQYKLLVYSYIFNAIYDEDLYQKYEYGYEDLVDNKNLFYSYIRFVITVFKAQLEWNREYAYFYKKWRYLKLYLATVLYEGNAVDDANIIKTMEQNGHYENVYAEGYRPFVENVNRFLKVEKISDDDKHYIIYSLMMGRMGDYLQVRGAKVRTFSNEEKQLLKEIISQLDYREVNLSFYKIYWPAIKTGAFAEAEDIAAALSDYTTDTLTGLRNRVHDRKAGELFETIALQEKPYFVNKGVFQLEEEVVNEYKDLLYPMLCSRQFLFLIYGNIRSLLVQKRTEIGLEKYTLLLDYISKYNSNEAKAVKTYLLALNACLHGKREEVLTQLYETDITTGIPEQWKQEASNIKNYASGKINAFKPDSTIVDSSLEGKQKLVKFWFIDRLQHLLNVAKRRVDFDVAASLYEKYLEDGSDYQSIIAAGVDLCINYPKLDEKQKSELQIPSKNSLVLSLAIRVIKEKLFFNTVERFSILFDLYSGRQMFRYSSEGLKQLNDIIGQCLKTNVILEVWIKYRNVIKEYLDNNHMLMDYQDLKERILDTGAELLEEDYSQEKRYSRFKQLLEKSEGLESIYSRNVFDAMRRFCKKIEESARLEITIENENSNVTDGYVYFMIRNIGKCAVSFADEYEVVFKQEGHPESKITVNSISDLQSGFITGGRVKLVFSRAEHNIPVTLAIYKKSNPDRRELLCDVTDELRVSEVESELQVTEINRYMVGTDSAVTDADMLFGREDIKSSLKYKIPAGVTVMYGPSRIGKTSIMNWIRNTLAVNQGNVMSIIFGGEGGMGKESDYQENFVKDIKHIPVPYDNDEEMAEYLLVSTIIQSMTTMKYRLRFPSMKRVTDKLMEQIVEILGDTTSSIVDRYLYVNKLLVSDGIELWLLLDEFQQVVERWRPKASCEFTRVCKILLSEGKNSNIKLVLCGSDDLLRHMVLEDESVWRLTFPKYTRVSVDPLKKEAFCDMIVMEKKITGTNLIYSKSALDALFSYTGGVALYGKEIGNVVLDNIERSPSKYRGRNVVYAFDIAEATQSLLNRQASELDTKAKEGIREIYDAVTKNLKIDTDMQYLWFIAKWLKENPNYESFAETVFTSNKRLRDENELHDCLEIAVARGILDCNENEGVNNYIFRTIFYYFAFLGSAKNNLDESKIFLPENLNEVDDDPEENALTLIDKFDDLSDTDRMTVLSSVYHQKLNPKARREFRESIGDVVQTKINEQNNYVMNVQNMTNSLYGIITANDPTTLLKRIQDLPRLVDYLPQLAIEQGEAEETVSDELISRAMDNYVDDVEAGLETIRLQQSHNVDGSLPDVGNSSGNDVAIVKPYAAILGLSDDEYEEFMEQYNLPEYFLHSLSFASQLDELFMRGAVGDDTNKIDFSPVTIMYCKLIESLLKEYHTKIYGISLGTIDTDMRKPENRDEKYKWKEIIELPITQQQLLTIGSFVHPLYKKWAVNNLAKTTRKEPHEWIEHKKMIMALHDIRNPSAHGSKGQRISLQQKETITELLINKHGFLRLIELALG